MEKYKYVILGAGPAGLAFANRLLERGEKSFIVLEKENEAGGLCRSEMVDGSCLDIGGGHFLDVRNKKALDFVFKFMPENEWNIFDRVSKIQMGEQEIDYPFESNLWQFPSEVQVDYLQSVFKAGCNFGKKIPKKFVDWISWKLGDKIAKDYMIPYNQKIWSINLNRLGTYWLYKLPNVSLRETLLSCLEKRPSGSLPAHAKFYYPKKYGYGEVWKRMAEMLGDRIRYSFKVKTVDIKNKLINGEIGGDRIIVTIPWKALKFVNKVPKLITRGINSLEYSSIRISYCPDKVETRSHWTYIPDKTIPHHRCLYRFNFCKNSKGYWTEMNEKRKGMLMTNSEWFYVNKFAYPINTLNKTKIIKGVLGYFSKKSIYGLGRWGEWEQMNSDIAVVKGLELADKL